MDTILTFILDTFVTSELETFVLHPPLPLVSPYCEIEKKRKPKNDIDDKSGSLTHKRVGEPDYTMIFIT